MPYPPGHPKRPCPCNVHAQWFARRTLEPQDQPWAPRNQILPSPWGPAFRYLPACTAVGKEIQNMQNCPPFGHPRDYRRPPNAHWRKAGGERNQMKGTTWSGYHCISVPISEEEEESLWHSSWDRTTEWTL